MRMRLYLYAAAIVDIRRHRYHQIQWLLGVVDFKLNMCDSKVVGRRAPNTHPQTWGEISPEWSLLLNSFRPGRCTQSIDNYWYPLQWSSDIFFSLSLFWLSSSSSTVEYIHAYGACRVPPAGNFTLVFFVVVMLLLSRCSLRLPLAILFRIFHSNCLRKKRPDRKNWKQESTGESTRLCYINNLFWFRKWVQLYQNFCRNDTQLLFLLPYQILLLKQCHTDCLNVLALSLSLSSVSLSVAPSLSRCRMHVDVRTLCICALKYSLPYYCTMYVLYII